jgi:hypothetical protein
MVSMWDSNLDADMMAAAKLPDPNDRPPPDDPGINTGEFDVSADFGIDGRPPSLILEVLSRNRDAFTFDGKPGLVSGMEMTLDTNDDKLVPERLRQMTPAKKEITDDTMNQLLDWDIIEESDSRLSFLVVIVKQNGKYRFCVDYRNLNRHTKPTIYPMQRSDEMFEALGGKSVFSNLDAVRGYHQIEVAETDRWKTAFLTHRGLYHYKRMLFGLKTAPAVFQRFMDNMLGRLRCTCALCYIDDVIIFSNSIKEHARHIDAVLTAARSTGLKFSHTKCHFAYSSLTLLGRKISPEGLEILEDKAAAVTELAPPTNIRELWHILGLFSYYQAFIHRYSIIAAPLTDLTKGVWVRRNENGAWDAECAASLKAPLQWTAECEQAFAQLKKALTDPPTLAYPDFNKPFILYVDACHQGMACALHQVMDEPDNAPERQAITMSVHDGEYNKLALLQQADNFFGPKYMETQASKPPPGYEIKKGILRHESKICLPNDTDFLRDLLHDCHDSMGHFGVAKTLAVVRKTFYRPGLHSVGTEYCSACGQCKGSKRSRLRPIGEMHAQSNIRGSAFECIAIDVMMGLTVDDGKDPCLVISDTFTKHITRCATSSSATAMDIAELLFTRLFNQGWIPSTIISDMDSKYISEVWKALMQ